MCCGRYYLEHNSCCAVCLFLAWFYFAFNKMLLFKMLKLNKDTFNLVKLNKIVSIDGECENVAFFTLNI